MGVLDVLSGLANAAGQGYAGYAQDQQLQVKQALAAAAAQQQAARDAVLNRVALAGIDPTVQGNLAGVRARATVQPHLDEAAGLAKIAPYDSTAPGIAAAADRAGKVTASTNAANAASPAPVPAMTPYQTADLKLRQAQYDAQAKARADAAAKPTPDQVKSQTVNDLAGPAADALVAYYGSGNTTSAAAKGAAAVSHIPFAGNYLTGKVDPEYQNAMNSARTLATQYLEIMPKSRFQPSTVDDIMSQIAPNAGDAPPVQAAKLARVRTLKAAITARAALRPDASPVPLDDIPPPPGMDQP